MKSNTKSSITLPLQELSLVNRLMKILKAKSKVEVIRLGLKLLQSQIDREELRQAYKKASWQVKDATNQELKDLDHLSNEGLDSL